MSISWLTIAIPAAVILLAVGMLLLTDWMKRRLGLPAGKIVYTDAQGWGKTEKPLYDSTLGLTGRPDYLIQKKDELIPVEVKSTWAPSTPYDSHVLQLAAYCLLAEKNSSIPPKYGLIAYHNRTFRFPYTQTLRGQVADLVETIRDQKDSENVDRSHEQPQRCARCGFREVCDQRL